MKHADESSLSALKDFDDGALGSACAARTLATANNARFDAVAMHGVPHVVTAYEQIAFHAGHRLIGNDEAITIAMRDETAGDRAGTFLALWRRCTRRRGSGSPARMRLRITGSSMRLWRRDLLARESEASTAHFFNFAAALQASDNLVQVAPHMVAQVQSASDLAKAGRLAHVAEVSENVLVG
jgi:hypothetical protein